MKTTKEIKSIILDNLDDILYFIKDNNGNILFPEKDDILKIHNTIINNPSNIPYTYYIEETNTWYEKQEKYISIDGEKYILERFNDITKKINNETKLKTDYITGISNKASAIEQINNYIIYAIKNNEEFAVIISDIDYFKEINDEYGHVFGDIVLRNIGELILNNTRNKGNRNQDISGRFGGDEFFGILKNITYKESESWVLRAHNLVKKLVHHSSDYSLVLTNITMSIGMYHINKEIINNLKDSNKTIDQIREEIFQLCDQNLYQIKELSHNNKKLQNNKTPNK